LEKLEKQNTQKEEIKEKKEKKETSLQWEEDPEPFGNKKEEKK
jgi:hypothetical protein